MALAETFKDSFAGSDLSGCWQNFSFGGGVAHGAGPGLVLSRNATSFGGGWLETLDLFDLRDSLCTIHLLEAPSDPAASGGSVFFQFACNMIGDGAGQFNYYPATGGGHTAGDLDCQGFTSVTLNPAPLWWRFRGDGEDLYLETSDDGDNWTTRAHTLAAQHGGGSSLEFVNFDLQASRCTAIVLTYNYGGTPGCPSFPLPPRPPVRQDYVWRDAKGHTAVSRAWFSPEHPFYDGDLALISQAANDGLPAESHGLATYQQGVTYATLQAAHGPFDYDPPLVYGSEDGGVDIADRVELLGMSEAGEPVMLVVPAPDPALFFPNGWFDVGDTASPSGLLVTYWLQHCCTRTGATIAGLIGGWRRRGETRSHMTAVNRDPTLAHQA